MPLSECSRRPAPTLGVVIRASGHGAAAANAAGGSELTRGEEPDIFAPRVGEKRPADFVRARQPSDAWAWRVLAIAIAAKLHEYSNGTSGQRGYGWCSPTTGVVERVLGGVAVDAAAGRGVIGCARPGSFSRAVRAPCQALLLFSARDFEQPVPRFARRPTPPAPPAPPTRDR